MFDLTNTDLVIIPTNTFVADYLAVKHLPLTEPFVALIDHDEHFTIDTNHLELFLKNRRGNFNKVVVIPVHLYGHSCDMDTIMRLSKEYNFHVIEDCSQSHETKYKNNQIVKGNGYCYIGFDNHMRECTDVYEGDICMSGQIFPTLDVCVNPEFRP